MREVSVPALGSVTPKDRMLSPEQSSCSSRRFHLLAAELDDGRGREDIEGGKNDYIFPVEGALPYARDLNGHLPPPPATKRRAVNNGHERGAQRENGAREQRTDDA